MLAKLHDDIPRGDGWVYEPKWDGFRAIVFKDDDRTRIASRNALPLERYFPELVETLEVALPEPCVADGEIVIAGPSGLDFEALQMRLHPAESRVRRLAIQTPASFVAFDLLAAGGEDLRAQPLDARRRRLLDIVRPGARCFVTPQTADPAEAASWFERFEGAGLDGVVAKRADGRYVEGERVMVKVKHLRTADCVVGGYRLDKHGKSLGSLLLGLYDSDGVLHFVGHTSSFNAAQRREVLAKLRAFEGGESFAGGRAPGGPSRWSRDRDLSWVPLEPRLVCEVAFDHLQGYRFRHATRFLRWRPDKDPKECVFDQLEPPHPFSLDDIVAMAAPSPKRTGGRSARSPRAR